LEIWPAVPVMGGLSGLKEFAEAELFPWVRDEQLSVRRLLMAGVPGVGKSYCARWLAHRLGCECARLSVPALKAGLVGASEANLRRALRVIDALGSEAPLVVVLDEIDTVAREGLDGGTSSGMFAELLTWLQESTSQAIVLATLNRLDKLDAALESRFQARFFFDLPALSEREAVAKIHYVRLGCEQPDCAGESTARRTEGYSSREIAEHVCPSVARRSRRSPTPEVIEAVLAGYTPASRTQADQLTMMRRSAASLRRANDPLDNEERPTSRRVI
jgi:SpoVK/Ycf46/Vps4 family AAA+-type ATPase